MNTSKKLSVLCILCGLIICIFWILLSVSNHIERTNGQMANEVYVWQRQWDSTVSQALIETAPELTGFAVLNTEVAFKQGQVEQVVRVPVNYEDLKATQKPVALALRIGPYDGTFKKDYEITSFLSTLANSLIVDAHNNGIEPSELQIDFDCSESKLADYLELVKILRTKISPVPIVITALPSWLKHRAFKALVQASDGFVLQVHSLERPKSPNTPIVLCDVASSLKWVEKAARLNVPFRVALPTYGYIIGFDRDGKFLGLTAEGPSQTWPDDAIVRVVNSDATAIAELVQKWQMDRPANMQGLIWYRLPVKTDQLNWKWKTLSLVMNGQKPREEIKVDVNFPQAGFAQITLINAGQMDCSGNLNIKIECEPSKILTADGMNNFVFENSETGVAFKYRKENKSLKISPDEKLMAGWLRFNGQTEVKAHVSRIH